MAVRAHASRKRYRMAIRDTPHNLLRLLLHLLLFAPNVRDNVREDVHRCNAWVAGSGDSLHGSGNDALDTEFCERGQGESKNDGRAVRIRNDHPLPATIPLLSVYERKMSRIDFGHE